jgi:uncharacterized RDD family membrane protein YckC
MEAGSPTHCARCGAIVEGETCPQCGLERGAPAWQPPAQAAPYGAPQPPGPEQPAAPASPPPAQGPWSGPPPQQQPYGYQQQWGPPGPQLPPGELSGWWRRVGASILDWLVMMLGVAVVFFVVWAATGDAETAGVSAYVAYLFITFAIYGLVYAPLLMAREGPRNGQTLGKQALGIRVARLDGQPMNYGTGALREFVAKTLVFQLAAAFVLGLATLLDYLWPLWDDRNQALHDQLASTVVMKG